jgi:hypothetical protein
MKKAFQIFRNDGIRFTFNAIEKSTHETNIKVHDFFEQGIPCLILCIEHDQLNTLLDLTKTSPYTLIYFDNDFDDKYYFAAAAFSNNETESAFFINTQFKKILFIPSSYKLLPSDIDKDRDMKTVNVFFSGYGQFPYIIIKTGDSMYTQIPIKFNGLYGPGNYVMANIDNISDELRAGYKDELLAGYKKGKRSELHDIIIKHCQWYITKLEADKKLDARICLVEGPEIAYYFDGDEINFTNVIPSGGTLVTGKNVFIAMNTDHYLESCMYSQI